MQTHDPVLYRRATLPKATTLFLVAPERYLDLAVNHSVWINLKAPDLRADFEKGVYTPNVEEIRESERQRAKDLRSRLRVTLFSTALAAAIASTIAYAIGSIGFESDFNLRKIFASTGTFLIGWATLFELGTGLVTWSGETLSELVHPKLFQVIFVPGLSSLFFSTIM